MTDQRGERLARALSASAAHRRTILRLFGGALPASVMAGWGALLGIEDAETKGKHKHKKAKPRTKKRDAPCQKGKECVSGYCNQEGSGRGRCDCGERDDPCADGRECCSAICVDNACGCQRAGSPCVDGRDCCDSCVDGKCCALNDSVCLRDDECCSGTCDIGTGKCCGANGDVCIANAECCSNDAICRDGSCQTSPCRTNGNNTLTCYTAGPNIRYSHCCPPDHDCCPPGAGPGAGEGACCKPGLAVCLNGGCIGA